MIHISKGAIALSKSQAKSIWLVAQRLNEPAPFGDGPGAAPTAIEHLGYVQIDTINVIERCHHHVLYTRIPQYRREHLRQAQSIEKSVFEYRAHALAYIPTEHFRHYVRTMKTHRTRLKKGESTVKESEVRKLVARIRRNGALTLRDIEDDLLIDKTDGWMSRKPSARALRLAFYSGAITVSERNGILKTYELTKRHFGWENPPKAASERETANYVLDRALRAQGIVSLDSICHLDAPRKPAVRKLIAQRVRRKELIPVAIEGTGKQEHWAIPETFDAPRNSSDDGLVHILSPFDPLIIQRKRLKLFFDYEHVFEAYVPKEKRKYGYFALPVLVGDQIVAAIDLKTDRGKGKLLLRKWTWLAKASRTLKPRIEDELHRFEKFQLAR